MVNQAKEKAKRARKERSQEKAKRDNAFYREEKRKHERWMRGY